MKRRELARQALQQIDVAAFFAPLGEVAGEIGEMHTRVREALGEGSAETIGSLRAHLAAKAFEHSWAYDRAIAEWLTRDRPADESSDETSWPKEMTLELQREFEPRYGENPHQAAAV